MTNKEYSNGEVTIVWQPEKCIHAGDMCKNIAPGVPPKRKAMDKAGRHKCRSTYHASISMPFGSIKY